MAVEKPEDNNKKTFNLAEKFQYVPTVLLVLMVFAFVLNVPPEYGVFILAAVITAYFLAQKRMKKP